MHVLLTVRSRLVYQVLRDLLRSYDRTFSSVPIEKALAAEDRPGVIYWAREWNREAQAEFSRLAGTTVLPFVICNHLTTLRSRLIVLKSGARGVATEDEDDLEALVLQISRIAAERDASQWRVGRMVFDASERCLYDVGVRVSLSPTEARLLKRLCLESAEDPERRLSTRQLTSELSVLDAGLKSKESSVRTYVTRLRRLIEDDPEQPTVLKHNGKGYFVVVGPDDAKSH